MLRLRYRQLDGLQCIGSQDIWRIVRNHFDLRILWQVRWSWEDIRERMCKHGLRWLELVFIQEASSRTVLLQFGNSCTHELYRVNSNVYLIITQWAWQGYEKQGLFAHYSLRCFTRGSCLKHQSSLPSFPFCGFFVCLPSIEYDFCCLQGYHQ